MWIKSVASTGVILAAHNHTSCDMRVILQMCMNVCCSRQGGTATISSCCLYRHIGPMKEKIPGQVMCTWKPCHISAAEHSQCTLFKSWCEDAYWCFKKLVILGDVASSASSSVFCLAVVQHWVESNALQVGLKHHLSKISTAMMTKKIADKPTWL